MKLRAAAINNAREKSHTTSRGRGASNRIHFISQ